MWPLQRLVVALAVAFLWLGVPRAWATHVQWYDEGTDANGDAVSFQVVAADGPPTVQNFRVRGAGKGKTAAGADCSPRYPPPAANDSPVIVDHAFSDITPPVMISGSFTEPKRASGTFRFRGPSTSPPFDTCDTGTVSWTASCLDATPACPFPPTFTRTASAANVSTNGRVTLPMRIDCPPPGDFGCQILVTATARVPTTTLSASGWSWGVPSTTSSPEARPRRVSR